MSVTDVFICEKLLALDAISSPKASSQRTEGVLRLIRRGVARELNLQPSAGETGQEWAGVDDLLRHPGSGFGNTTLDELCLLKTPSGWIRLRWGFVS